MKILVTGGAGYLGSVLVPKLLDYGHRVSVVDSFVHGVPSLTMASRHHKALEITVGDLVREPGLLTRMAREADAIIHLAAMVGAPLCDRDPEKARLLNQRATEDLVETLRPDQPIVYPCTNSGYGKGGDSPVTEDDPMNPLSVYGVTKVAGEEAVIKHPLGVSLRLATLYGPSPRMRFDLLVNDFVFKAIESGHVALFEPQFRRCVLHVDDAAEALALAIENSDTLGGRAWNVGAENVTKIELCERVASVTPFSWHIEEGHDPDQRDYDVSSDRFRKDSGWAPLVQLDDGLRQLVKVFRQPFNGPQWRNV